MTAAKDPSTATVARLSSEHFDALRRYSLIFLEKTVFQENKKEVYNVYLTGKGSAEDLRTTREIISNDRSRPFIEKMIKHLANPISVVGEK